MADGLAHFLDLVVLAFPEFNLKPSVSLGFAAHELNAPSLAALAAITSGHAVEAANCPLIGSVFHLYFIDARDFVSWMSQSMCEIAIVGQQK